MHVHGLVRNRGHFTFLTFISAVIIIIIIIIYFISQMIQI
jgi:hypothetical protein